MSKTWNVTGRLRWCVCPCVCVWLCPLGSDCGGRMSQVDRVAGSLNTSKTHTQTDTGLCTHSLPAGSTAATQKCPCGCQPAAPPHLPTHPPIVCPDGATPVKNGGKERAKAESVAFEVRWGHKVKKKKKDEEDRRAAHQSKESWESMKERCNTEVKELFWVLVKFPIRCIIKTSIKYNKRSSPPPGNPSAAVWADDVGHRVPACSWAPVGEVHWACAHISRKLLGVLNLRRGSAHD